MTAGRLAALSPGATTASVLYSTDVDTTASTVLHVAERGNAAATYRVGHKDYTQKLTMDASTYKFQRGNPISNYKIQIAPGITRSNATPGLAVASSDTAKKAKILDAFVATGTITNYVKTMTYSSVGTNAAGQTGTFQGGETVTGGTSSLTATFRGSGTGGSMNIEIADITTGASTIKIINGAAVTDVSGNGDPHYFVLDQTPPTGYATEILQTTSSLTFYSGATGGADVGITRGLFGTSAGPHRAGQNVALYKDQTTTTALNTGGAQLGVGATTVPVVDGTQIVSGQYFRIGNEILLATNVVANDITVTRGQWGTTDAAHNDGSTVTPMTQAASQGYFQWFDTAETLTGGTSNATVDTQFTATSSALFTTGFVWGTVSGQEIVPSEFTFDVDRTYLFDQADSSNTGLPLRFSDIQEGTGATVPGTEYTIGITKTGTAGTDGTIQIIPTSNTPNPLYYYAEGVPSTIGVTNYSSGLQVVQDPIFTEIFLYDVEGTWITGDTFTIGTASQTVGTVTAVSYTHLTLPTILLV